NGSALIGVSGEVKLPDFDSVTEKLSGPGILGEIETAIIGSYGSQEQEITFRILDDDIFSFMDPTQVVDLTLRGSQQYTVKSTGTIDYRGMRVAVRGRKKKFQPGTVKQGGTMDATLTLELTYILIEIDGNKKVELDKLNNVFKINDKDVLSKIRSQC
ncbi:MAG: phage major tail tube protein, partial [Sporomusa sp.]